MDVPQWLILGTCAGSLALGVVAMLRLRQSPLAGALALGCMFGFAWRFSVWAFSLTGAVIWLYLERIVAAWAPSLGLHIVLAFLGLRRRLRAGLALSYALDGVLSAIVAIGLFWAAARPAAESRNWELVLTAHMLACTGVSGVLLVRHLRACSLPEESMRTKIMLAACALALVVSMVSLVFPEPGLLMVVLLACGLILLTTVTFGFRLFDSELTGLFAVYSASLVVIVGGGYLVASRVLASSSSLLLFASLALLACLVVLVVQAAAALVRRRARTARFATLGRWSAYMAHDFKNPLSALKGAAQFLAEERRQGRSIDGQGEMLDLLVSESDRLSRLLDHYQRFGDCGAERERTSVNQLIGPLLSRANLPRSVRVRAQLEDELPACLVDCRLLGAALENVLRNAAEAMPGGGTLTLRTRGGLGAAAPRVVTISVEDTGQGMNPRQVEQAFDEFFSTKPGVRGLGLSLVKRVVDAHGGDVRISSQLGRGTQVVLQLPAT
jgi:two-component system, NtrC family, sensor histidine kinase HydH